MRSMHAAVTILMFSVFGACAGGANSAGSPPSPASFSSAATARSSASSVVGAVDAADAPFVGSTKSKRFYPSTCGMAKLIKPAERVGFTSIKDAEKAGFARDQFGTYCK